MYQILEVIHHLNNHLKIDHCLDNAINGLQVGNQELEINKIAFAVNATILNIQSAIEAQCQLLLVHHGLFWGKSFPLVGYHYEKLKSCVSNSLAIGGYHLPLDVHPILGNNAQIANLFEYTTIIHLNDPQSHLLGCIITLNQPLTIASIYNLFETKMNFHSIKMTLNHKKPISTIGILSGKLSLSFLSSLQSQQPLDLIITGETDLSVINETYDQNFPLLLLGHTQSEIFGIKALKNYICQIFPSLESIYVENKMFTAY